MSRLVSASILISCLVSCLMVRLSAQNRPPAQNQQSRPAMVYLLMPSRVWDGVTDQSHDGWVVRVRGERIEAVGPAAEVKAAADAKVIEMSGTTLMPGLIEAHSQRIRRIGCLLLRAALLQRSRSSC